MMNAPLMTAIKAKSLCGMDDGPGRSHGFRWAMRISPLLVYRDGEDS